MNLSVGPGYHMPRLLTHGDCETVGVVLSNHICGTCYTEIGNNYASVFLNKMAFASIYGTVQLVFPVSLLSLMGEE